MGKLDQVVVFLVGLGAPASLYTDYITDLKKRLPYQTKLFVLEWWNQDDFGVNELQTYINNSEVILIGHSAGSVIALQTLAQWPRLVKKIIMLDSHFLRKSASLATVSHMLEVILNNDSLTIQQKVKNAYLPILENDLIFNKALKFAIEWMNHSFDNACTMLNALPVHSSLYIGFTNSRYQMLSSEDKAAVLALWEKFSVGVKFFPMSHFALIDEKYAADINQLINQWLINLK